MGDACWVDFEQRYLDWVCAWREVVFGFGLLFGTKFDGFRQVVFDQFTDYVIRFDSVYSFPMVSTRASTRDRGALEHCWRLDELRQTLLSTL